jgi:protein-disulfide isomerase
MRPRTMRRARAAAREAGDVRVIHRDWPILGPDSLRAARIALAAARQDRYLPVHNALMASPGLSETAIRDAATGAGADWPRIEADLAAEGADISERLARAAQDALRLGFRGTPGFLIGPIRIEGGASKRQFANAIDRARAGAG